MQLIDLDSDDVIVDVADDPSTFKAQKPRQPNVSALIFYRKHQLLDGRTDRLLWSATALLHPHMLPLAGVCSKTRISMTLHQIRE